MRDAILLRMEKPLAIARGFLFGLSRRETATSHDKTGV